MGKIEDTIKRLNKKFDEGAANIMDGEVAPVKVVSTGSYLLDRALGVGGFPVGRIIEIYGPESSGKTTIALSCIAECHKNGGIAAFIDAEHAFDRQYAENLGVDMKRLIMSQPSSGEQAMNMLEDMLINSDADVYVVDSVAALVPKAELEGEVGDSKIGLHARMMSQTMRKITSRVNGSGAVVIFINQIREKVGVMFGNPEVTTGGNALKFYASVRLDVRRSTQIKDGKEVTGNLTKVNVVKNKVAPPFNKVEFNIIYGRGIDRTGEVIDIAIETGILSRAGSWFSFGGEKIANGRHDLNRVMSDNPELMESVELAVNEKMEGFNR